jgi:hypothetical protein
VDGHQDAAARTAEARMPFDVLFLLSLLLSEPCRRRCCFMLTTSFFFILQAKVSHLIGGPTNPSNYSNVNITESTYFENVCFLGSPSASLSIFSILFLFFLP